MIVGQYLTSVRIYQPKAAVLSTKFDTVARSLGQGKRFNPVPQNERVYRSLKQCPRLVVLQTVQVPGTVRSNSVLDLEKAWAYLDKKGLRPAMYDEGLCFAEQFPEVQREFSVVLSGSKIRLQGRDSVACLWGDRLSRGIYLLELGTALHSDALRFLAAKV